MLELKELQARNKQVNLEKIGEDRLHARGNVEQMETIWDVAHNHISEKTHKGRKSMGLKREES